MAEYALTAFGHVVRVRDGASIPNDEGNADWREYQQWLAAGNAPDPADIQPAPRRLISKATIIDRLIDAKKLDAARAALDAQPLAVQEKWNARTAIYADDKTALALFKAIGADPAIILAPE